MAAKRGPKTEEFGDYQTPRALAERACRILSVRGLAPASVVEPTCGVGNFLLAALDQFPSVERGLGLEINPDYVGRIGSALAARPDGAKVRLLRQDFFDADWPALLRDLPEPILVVGNPPWVTSARVGALGGGNLPAKTNFLNLAGLDALTGKSNFDISEWMIIALLKALKGRNATAALLCKTGAARKVLAHVWKSGLGLGGAEIRRIDAAAFFGAAVDACLLTCSLTPDGAGPACRVYPDLDGGGSATVIGYEAGRLIADLDAHRRWGRLGGRSGGRWRSGIKHDCSKVMELFPEAGRYRNGLGELVELEDEYLYPMLKSSEVANGRTTPRRWMLVPQRAVGDDTGFIRARAPKTWAYLQGHGAALDRRASSIYRRRPRFSVFGVGEYSFSPWKVAISGFYKGLRFVPVGGYAGKPVVPDDTCYFLPCRCEEEARLVASLLNSDPAREFYSAYVFWDAKRPITVELLGRLDLSALARELGAEETLARLRAKSAARDAHRQPSLFDEE